MERTPNTNLPYIMPQQAQKHVTHNEAIRLLDALVQTSIIAAEADPQQLAPSDGDTYLVAPTAIGEFAGHEDELAAWQDGAWTFISPAHGWIAFDKSADKPVVYDGAIWKPLPTAIDEVQDLQAAGINTSADNANRLAVSAPSSLFTHEGNDHRMVINKSASGDTASLLFQTDYSGRAEIGTSGSDDFNIKVCDPSEQWREAISVNHQTGQVRFPSGVENPALYGVPDSLTDFDRLYLDAINGSDANDGKTATTALQSFEGLAARFTIGRKLEIRLLSDMIADYLIIIGYVVPALNIYGRSSDDTAWENRKITVVDSINNANHPGGFMLQAFTSVYTFQIDVELATAKPHAFLNFYNTVGYLRTHTMTLTRSGVGSCCLFANGASFVPNQHTGLVVDPTAQGYIATGLASGANPNSDWRYPSNLNDF